MVYKIHKSFQDKDTKIMLLECGRNFYDTIGDSSTWDKVTCKDCLKKR